MYNNDESSTESSGYSDSSGEAGGKLAAINYASSSSDDSESDYEYSSFDDSDKRKKDSMISGKEKSQPAKLKFDTVEYSFNHAFRPKDLFKKSGSKKIKNNGNIKLSRGNGLLKPLKRTKPSDLEHGVHGQGKHDLIQSVELVSFDSNYKGVVRLDFPTVNTMGNEKYFENNGHVGVEIHPTEVSSDKPFNLKVVDREVLQGTVEFLKEFRGQTPTNIDSPKYITKVNEKHCLVRVTEPKSAVMYFYNRDKDDKGVLVNTKIDGPSDGDLTDMGMFRMDTDKCEKYINQAKESMQRNYCFADATSKDFALELSAVPVTTESLSEKAATTGGNLGFADFSACHACRNSGDKYKGTEIGTAFMNTPIHFRGKIRITYKKVNAKEGVKFDGK